MIAYKNTDRQLYRELTSSDSIHVTEDGGIGINCAGTVLVRPLREWHRLGEGSDLRALRLSAAAADVIQLLVERLIECSDDLEGEIEARMKYGNDVHHPSQKGRYERDMAPVFMARDIIESIRGSDGQRDADE